MTTNQSPAPAASGGALYRRIWRWHFYAGLLCLPFIFSLAVTGALYLFHQQIDDFVYADLLLRRESSLAASHDGSRSAVQLIQLAQQAVPGVPRAISLPGDAGRNSQVDIARADGVTMQVFLDPASGALRGTIPESERLMTFIKHLHSLAVVGDGGKMLIEIVAGWIIVLIATGAYLWWPRGRRHGVFSIRPRATGRNWWRDLHAVTGAFAAIVILFLALTGMPWSIVWGQNVNRLLTEHGLGVPDGMWRNVPKSGLPAGSLGEVPWNLQQQPLPASEDDPHAAHRAAAVLQGGQAYQILHNSAAASPDAIIATARSIGLQGGYRLALPRDERSVYSAVRTPGQLDGQRVVHFDQYSGRVLMDLGAAQFGAIGRATEWGVSVHQGGEYGWSNLLLMLAGCLALIALCISGVVVWWARRPAGRLAAPARRGDDRLAPGVILIAAALGLLFPLLGASMLAALLIDFLLSLAVAGQRQRPAQG